MKLLSKLYCLLCLLLGGLLLWQLPQGGQIETDLGALLPVQADEDAARQAAEAANNRLLNGQILLLVGAAEPEQAFAAASGVAAQWRHSGLFTQVDDSITPDVAAIRDTAQNLGLAALPAEQVQQLYAAPQQYFQERAEAAANPFAAGILPLDQDWLGFGRFVTGKQTAEQLQWQPENGMLYTERDGMTWVWLRAKLPEQQGGAGVAGLLPLLETTQTQAQAGGYQVLAAGGALFAAHAKASAERESTLMSVVGLTLTLSLLLWVFRRARALLLFIPLAAGVLLGLAATVAVFGHIHVLTLVIGTSLVGVLVDFPLHWLAPALFRRDWQADAAMSHVRPVFLVSLVITVSGYVLLWFTPLPVLRQTAVFSAAALLGAFAATLLWLPPLFRRYRPGRLPFARQMETLVRLLAHLRGRSGSLGGKVLAGTGAVLLCALWAGGVWQTVWQDDIRNWSAMPASLLEQTRRVADLSGLQSGGQFLLLDAATPDQLLRQSRTALTQLEALGLDGKAQALSQWLMPEDEQRALQQQLRALAAQPGSYAPMLHIGVPADTMRQALLQAAERPTVSLPQSLTPDSAEAWRNLYVGAVGQRQVALVRFQHLNPEEVVQVQQAYIRSHCDAGGCIRLIDQRASLNEQFRATRDQAAWLKLLSFALAWLVLWRLFGWRRGSLILAVPLAAVAGSVSLLGWLGVPVSLFAMFGLLLTAAIGVDYVVYALTAREPAAARTGGITLAALTTAISFVLLAFSSTPAVAAFGLTVASGCAFNWLLAVWLGSVDN